MKDLSKDEQAFIENALKKKIDKSEKYAKNKDKKSNKTFFEIILFFLSVVSLLVTIFFIYIYIHVEMTIGFSTIFWIENEGVLENLNSIEASDIFNGLEGIIFIYNNAPFFIAGMAGLTSIFVIVYLLIANKRISNIEKSLIEEARALKESDKNE